MQQILPSNSKKYMCLIIHAAIAELNALQDQMGQKLHKSWILFFSHSILHVSTLCLFLLHCLSNFSLTLNLLFLSKSYVFMHPYTVVIVVTRSIMFLVSAHTPSFCINRTVFKSY